ncbi:MAG TPA: hypothetical protein VEH76_05450 [Methylocystis sp.]|nr:hypothetical protein [Methylocystis sp.]
MNKIVKRHYPTARLPDDLRDGLDLARTATITIELEDSGSSKGASTVEDVISRREPPFRTKQEIDADLRLDREEWGG